MIHQESGKITVSDINAALDEHFGQYGKTYETKQDAYKDLKERGYTNTREGWFKYGRRAWITPLRTAKLHSETREVREYKPNGFLVTYNAKFISHEHCRLKEVRPIVKPNKPRKTKN